MSVPHAEEHSIIIVKDSQRHLNEKAVKNNIAHILGINTKNLGARGWQITHVPYSGSDWHESKLLDDSANEYRNHLRFCARYVGDDAPGKSEIRSIVKTLNTRSTNPLGGRWTVDTVNGDKYEVSKDGDTVSTKDFTAYAEYEIPADFESHFDHLYGLDSHINTVKRSLSVAQRTTFAKRYHVALIGPPGCGKSDICETLASVLGSDAVMKFDATATTAAGAIKQIDEAEIMPRVLIVEEIEKVNAEALSFLLALMDMRGEIRKTTARSKIEKDTKILVIATVNNHKLFDGMLAGALSSRFSRKAWFHRPDPATIRRILLREVRETEGDEAWIEPCMAYCEEKNITDPRMISALCLTGEDGWLDGSFYKELADTDKPQEYED